MLSWPLACVSPIRADFEKLPIDRAGQPHQRMAQIDDRFQRRPQQVHRGDASERINLVGRLLTITGTVPNGAVRREIGELYPSAEG